MDRVYILNPSKKPVKWVETNDAEVNLSEIKIVGDRCIVPIHIVNDSLIEDDYLDNLADYDDIGRTVSYPKHCIEYIQDMRRNSFRSCIWYHNIEDVIPTAKSILIELSTVDELRNSINANIDRYPFIRLCTMSCKDKKEIPIYDNKSIETCIDDITTSERTKNLFNKPFCEGCKGKHLFMREVKNYDCEFRCFWSRDRLTAVSSPPYYEASEAEKAAILDFFNIYGKHIPYHSTIIDIGVVDGKIELIEFNSFGPDMKATAGNFSWYEDIMTLLFSQTTVFR